MSKKRKSDWIQPPFGGRWEKNYHYSPTNMKRARLEEFRQVAYKYLGFAKDATFELTDAILLTHNVYSLADLSLIALIEIYTFINKSNLSPTTINAYLNFLAFPIDHATSPPFLCPALVNTKPASSNFVPYPLTVPLDNFSKVASSRVLSSHPFLYASSNARKWATGSEANAGSWRTMAGIRRVTNPSITCESWPTWLAVSPVAVNWPSDWLAESNCKSILNRESSK